MYASKLGEPKGGQLRGSNLVLTFGAGQQFPYCCGDILSNTGGGKSNICFLARLPPKLGPGGLGTLMGESGVKFRVERHPPEVGRP